mmetsp:Transcript_13319/g.46491  ORF Transcript_13319/g.46491 Transcript_13319/m.46491 type:complete len:284 (-) Transcript_13319:3143-3994(-)
MCLVRASNRKLTVEVGSPSSVKERWVHSDGSFELLEILGRLYIRELGLDVLDPLVELQLIADLLALPVVLLAVGWSSHEVLEILDAPLQSLGFTLLEALDPLLVPRRGQDGLSGEELSELRALQGHSFVLALSHDVQKRLERGHCHVDTTVSQVHLSNALVRDSDGSDTIRIDFLILQFWLQHVLTEDRGWISKHTAKELLDKRLGDTITQDRGRNLLTIEVHVRDLLKIPILDEPISVTLLFPHATPNLWNQERDVMVNLLLGTNHSSRGNENVSFSQSICQ